MASKAMRHGIATSTDLKKHKIRSDSSGFDEGMSCDWVNERAIESHVIRDKTFKFSRIC